MNDTLAYILNKYGLTIPRRMPIQIPDMGRIELAGLFRELGFKVGVEVGVETGAYSEVLCKANPEAKLYSVDIWQTYKGYRDHLNQEYLDDLYQIARDRLAGYQCELIRKYSMDAVKDFPEESLDFVYIDANHELPYVIDDLVEWSRRVRSGGIVAGHDYKESKELDSRLHVVYAVNAYVSAYRIWPWFLLGTKAQIEGQVRDSPRSWMWVAQYGGMRENAGG